MRSRMTGMKEQQRQRYDSTVLAIGGRADNFLVGDQVNASETRGKEGTSGEHLPISHVRARWSA